MLDQTNRVPHVVFGGRHRDPFGGGDLHGGQPLRVVCPTQAAAVEPPGTFNELRDALHLPGLQGCDLRLDARDFIQQLSQPIRFNG